MPHCLRLLVVILALPLLAPISAYAQTQPSVMWGGYLPNAPLDMRAQYAFEWHAGGKGASIMHFGESWQYRGIPQGFPADLATSVRKHGSIPMIAWQSWDSSIQSASAPNEPEWRLSAIADGDYDPYITEWARAAKAWGHPFFLRFDHEMNGDWRFPWSEQINGNQPGDYVRMWRHVHDLFAQVGATNATWVWNPNYSVPKTTPLAELYPGDDYVDWVGLDGYNWGTDRGNAWQTFAQVFTGSPSYGGHNSYQELLTIAPTKPVMICETATSQNGGNPAAWITDTLSVQIPTRFPKIKAVVWFNWNEGDKTLDWPIETTLAMQAAFARAIGSPVYAANVFGGLPFGKIKPLGGS